MASMSNVVNAAMSRRVDYFEGTIIEAVSGNGAETMKLPVASNTIRSDDGPHKDRLPRHAIKLPRLSSLPRSLLGTKFRQR